MNGEGLDLVKGKSAGDQNKDVVDKVSKYSGAFQPLYIMFLLLYRQLTSGFPGSSMIKNPPVNVRNEGLIPEPNIYIHTKKCAHGCLQQFYSESPKVGSNEDVFQ